MLDERTEIMLSVANELTAEEIVALRALAPATPASTVVELSEMEEMDEASLPGDLSAGDAGEPFDGSTAVTSAHVRRQQPRNHGGTSTLPRGEYERQRTRESKVSTSCLGHERGRHDWWPVGTELVGRMGSELFTATVVENLRVKSNRSILITSGPANGRICITPTRAAMEATEAYRQANNLGRGGGVTNGWTFWKARC
jgi:hypothetical protein